jgi:hypothetical protein
MSVLRTAGECRWTVDLYFLGRAPVFKMLVEAGVLIALFLSAPGRGALMGSHEIGMALAIGAHGR